MSSGPAGVRAEYSAARFGALAVLLRCGNELLSTSRRKTWSEMRPATHRGCAWKKWHRCRCLSFWAAFRRRRICCGDFHSEILRCAQN